MAAGCHLFPSLNNAQRGGFTRAGMMSSSIFLHIFLSLASLAANPLDVAHALDNGLARTPPMGWMSWARFTCTTDCDLYPDDCVNENLFEQMKARLINDGYSRAGYEYINIDDCWSEMERDKTTGKLVENRQRFPNGMAKLSKSIHSEGLKFGLYGDCGTKTCAGYPAQLKSEESLDDNYFDLDANLLAEWKVDSFKFDGCNLAPSRAETVCPKMAWALNNTRRPMLLTCEWPFYMMRHHLNPDFQIAQESCNAWRYFEDVEDSWLSILSIVDFTLKLQSTIVKYHGPGSWFDPDQLVIGNYALSVDQARAQMALWSIWSAPLFMGNDLRHVAPEMAAILKNQKVIAVDQDQLGVFGLMVEEANNRVEQAFVKPVEPIVKGCPSFAVVYLNRATLGNTRKVSFKLRNLLAKVPMVLASQRYNTVYPDPSRRPGGQFDPEKCKAMYKLGMTRDPRETKLVIRPPNVTAESVEHKQIHYKVIDLFEDEPKIEPVGLDGDLTLRVNPSGVRMVKLIADY